MAELIILLYLLSGQNGKLLGRSFLETCVTAVKCNSLKLGYRLFSTVQSYSYSTSTLIL